MRKQLLTKVLLIAASLFVGTSAWAVTETYAISTWVEAAGSTINSISYGSTATTFKGAGDADINCYTITSEVNGNSLNGRFALSNTHSKSGLRDQVYFRHNGKGNNYTGLFVVSGRSSYFSVLDLSAGDKVTITFRNAPAGLLFYSSNATYDVSGTPTTIVSGTTAPTSGTVYTMTAGGHLDMYLPAYTCISQVVVETSAAETMGAPSIAATAANGIKRTVTITPGVGTGGSDATATYYTLDDSDPTSSGTRIAYTDPFEISATTNIKAVSYLGALAGDVTTKEITAGTTIQLNAPTITLTSFTLNSTVYNPTYTLTSNQSNLVGAPTPTITYSFNSGAATGGTSYTATEAGSLTVTVSAAGYDDNETTLSIEGGDFIKTYSFNTIDDVTVDTESGDWGSGTNVGGVQWTFTGLNNCTYTLRADISFSSQFSYARATTAKTKQGFYACGGAGTVNFSLNSAEYILFTTLGDNIIAKGTSTSQAIAHYTNVRAIDIYSPATVSKEITAAGWSTLYTPYALDFSGTGLTAYTATCDGTTVTLTPVENVPANTGVVLKGAANTYNIPVIASSSTAKGDLKGSATDAKAFDESYNYYYLAMNGANAQFKKLTSGSIAAGKAYLQLDKATPARELSVSFEEDVTAISSVELSQDKMQNEFFDLQGRRVAQPTKGLYIVNGKKIIIK